MSEQPILHEAYEEGQARPFTKDEAGAWVWIAVILGISLGTPMGVLAGGCVALLKDYSFLLCIGIGAGAGYLLMYGAIVLKGMWPQFRRMWSQREATTYAPPQPEQAQLPHPPIKVFPPGKKEPYLLTEPETPGRETLRLTPPVIAEIVQGVVERYDGKWSRRKLTRLTVAGGQKVSRGVYETLTAWFHRAGVLEQTPQGGFELVTKDLGELRGVFPGLPVAGQAGGEPGDRAGAGFQDTRPSGGAVRNLAERRRQRYLDCGCDVADYLERKGHHD